MPVTLIGGGPATPIDYAMRYRITWRFVAAPLAPNAAIDTYNVAEALRDSLPANGIVAVSNIEALAGDAFIQFTTQLTSSFHGFTLADLVREADRLPLFSWQAATSLRSALDVSEIEIRAAGLSQTIVRAQDQVSRQRAIDAANQAEVTTQIKDTVASVGDAAGDAVKSLGEKIDEYLKGLFGGVADVAKFALGVAAIVGLGYVIVRYRK